MKTETNLTATNEIKLTLTPQKAMELIRTLSSYAVDGKEFEVIVQTKSDCYDSDTPVALIGCGMSKTSGSLIWSLTKTGKEIDVHFDSSKAGA